MVKNILVSTLLYSCLQAMESDSRLSVASRLKDNVGIRTSSFRTSSNSNSIGIDMQQIEEPHGREGIVMLDLANDIPVDHEYREVRIEELFGGEQPDYDKISRLLAMYFNPNARAVTNDEHHDSVRQALHELHALDAHDLRTNIERLLKHKAGAKRLLDSPADFKPFADKLAARVYKHDLDAAAARLAQKDITLEEQKAFHEQLIKVQESQNSFSWKVSWGVCSVVYLSTWIASIFINYYATAGNN